MFRKYTFLLLLFLTTAYGQKVFAQVCTELGQNPSTAFPVCGTNVFKQSSVPICGGKTVPLPACNGGTDKNPFWYKFTVYETGTLGFLIEPLIHDEDYDWQLFDITGHNPDDVYTDASLIVTANWAGTYGNTGTSSSGVSFIQCGSDPTANKPTFAAMPTVTKGHTYLLLISHFSNTQSGYNLSFGGGTAVITDTTKPHLKSASISCDAMQVTVITNKKMQCSSLASNGTDFALSSGIATITGAVSTSCSTGFDLDTIVLTLSAPLPAGTYSILSQNGTDQNTLLDNCSTNLPVGEEVKFTVFTLQPTPLDSIIPVGCAPTKISAYFKKPIKCASISPDGSDFAITGPTAVTVVSATAVNCNNGTSPLIDIVFSGPIQTKGVYTLHLQKGADGNTIIDACGQETPLNSTVNFTTYDTVSADFTYKLGLDCKKDTIYTYHDGRNEVNQWTWTFDNTTLVKTQNAYRMYTVFGIKNVQLIVSNGVCSDTTSKVIDLDNFIKAQFSAPEYLCPNEQAVFADSSLGKITSWQWDFGNNTISTVQKPVPQYYPPVTRTQNYTIKLIVTNSIGCKDTAKHVMQVMKSCYVAVPTAFTPNGDGLNDYLYPLNGFKVDEMEFKVFNRFGQLVFETRDWTKKWDGTLNGSQMPPGTYVWTFSYTDRDTKKKVFEKGTAVLIR